MASSFRLFGIVLYPYSLFMIAGAGVFFGLFARSCGKRRKGCFEENAFAVEMLFIATAAALPAAMLLDSGFHWLSTGRFVIRGATFYGGLIAAVGLYPLLLRLKKKRTVGIYERMCDLASAIPAGHCLGRIGCFFGGCCFGKPTDCIFGVTFPAGSAPYEYYGGAVSVHPTQLYEAAYLLLLFVFLWRFGKDRAFPLYLILYGTGRFFIEFLRGDERGALLPFLSPAQTLSILFVLVGIFVLFWRRKIGNAQKKSSMSP